MLKCRFKMTCDLPLPSINTNSYTDFAHAIYETGILSDPWFDGVERFRLDGVVLTPERARRLAEAAERIAYLHHELVEILVEHPELLTEFYPLTPYQLAMWQTSGGMWHGMARADLFVLENGRIVCCELNSDTPSGHAEAVLLNNLLYERNCREHGALRNPNAAMADAFIAMLRESHDKRTDAELRRVGLIYPTEMTEDLGMMTLLTTWMERVGITVVAGSPYNLHRRNGGIEVLDHPVDLIVRHYKTDWWGERETVWTDATDYPDSAPLHEPLSALLGAEMEGEVTIVNPFGSVVTQNKLSLAFMWEHIELFAPESQNRIRELIPETRRMITFAPERLLHEREAWVLKSDYGCEGRETICGAFVNDEQWRRAIETAVPEHFVAQRFFRVAPDEQGMLPNFGVYIFGGTATGFFTRLSKQSTEYSSVTAPTYVLAEGNEIENG